MAKKTRRSKITFEVDGQEIRGDIYRPKKKKSNMSSVIFLHERDGSRDDYKDLAKSLAKKGMAAMVFDFRGHGDSEGILGKQTIRDGLKDARAAYDALIEEDDMSDVKIGVVGRGFGGYLAALLSKDRDFKGMVIASPAIYKDEWIDLMYRNFPLKDVKRFRSQIDFMEIKSIKAIRKYSGKLLVIGNEEDKVVPESVVNAYFDNAVAAKKKEQKFIKGAGHKLEKEKHQKKYKKLVKSWVSKNL